MPKYYKTALSLALLSSTCSSTCAFQASRTTPLHNPLVQHHYPQTNSVRRVSNSNRSASVSASYNSNDDSSSGSSSESANGIRSSGSGGGLKSMPSLGEQVRTVTVAYIDSMSDDVQDFIGVGTGAGIGAGTDVEADEYDEAKNKANAKTAGKRRVLLDAATDGRLTFTYRAQIPITVAALTDTSTVGLVLKEVNNGIVSEMSLPLTNMNALRYVSNEEEIIQLQQSKKECTTDEKGDIGSIQIIDEKCPSIRNVKQGIVVSSVERGSLAWDLGIRAGDMVAATSATVGDVSAYVQMLIQY